MAGKRSVAIVQSYHGNMGFLGLPLVAATMGGEAAAVASVMLGVPTAVSTYVYTSELGGDESFASLNVFVTTVASLGTLSLLVWLFG